MPYRRALPFGFFVTSLIYLGFMLSTESSHMVGDDFGYDPGSRALPLLAGGVLAVVSLHLFIRERGAAADAPRQGRNLFVANLVLAVLFIALFRHLGFVLTTGLFMFALIALNYREAGETLAPARTGAWLAYSVGLLVALFSLARGVVKACYFVFHQTHWEAMRDPFIQASFEIAVVVPAFVAVGLVVRRRAGRSLYLTMSQTAVGTTMGIFILFRELFLVQLPKGVLFW